MPPPYFPELKFAGLPNAQQQQPQQQPQAQAQGASSMQAQEMFPIPSYEDLPPTYSGRVTGPGSGNRPGHSEA